MQDWNAEMIFFDVARSAAVAATELSVESKPLSGAEVEVSVPQVEGKSLTSRLRACVADF
jgi:hypothetical protein